MKRMMALKILAKDTGTEPTVTIAIAALLEHLDDPRVIADFLGIDTEIAAQLVDDIGNIPTDTPEAPKPKKARTPRSGEKTMLPERWWPSPEMAQYAYDLGFVRQEVIEIATTYRNYWRGKGEKMLDWSLTWQNWIRREAKRLGKVARKPEEAPIAQAAGRTDAEWAKLVDEFRKSRHWPPAFGPEPGEPGCKVPPHITMTPVNPEARVRLAPSSMEATALGLMSGGSLL